LVEFASGLRLFLHRPKKTRIFGGGAWHGSLSPCRLDSGIVVCHHPNAIHRPALPGAISAKSPPILRATMIDNEKNDLRSECNLALYPFGSFALSGFAAKMREIVIDTRWPTFPRRILYKLFSHFTTKRGIVADIEAYGQKRRLFVDESVHDKHTFRRGIHPGRDELLAFLEQAAEEPVFLDIGANNGIFTVTASQKLDPCARILAFEPNPLTFQKLQLHLRLNNIENVKAFQIALGFEEGELPLSVDPTDDGSCSLLAPATTKSINVAVRPLLAVLKEEGIPKVDLLKIDVEGYEDRVLMPFFRDAPKRYWPTAVLMEVNVCSYHWNEDVLSFMLANGYKLKSRSVDNAWLVNEST
jgi:FkbM family methyltransferase